MQISISQQRILKGIAIIGMMALHFWANPYWIKESNMYVGILPNKMYEIMGQFGNVCVSIFAFLTGYSFKLQQDKWSNTKYRVKKTAFFLMEYWIYIIIFLVVGYVCGDKLPSSRVLLANMIGLGTAVDTESICVPFAWYVSFYISLVILYPLLKKIMECRFFVCIIGMIIIYQFNELIYIFLSTFSWGQNIYATDFFRRENTIMALCVGYLFCKYRILEDFLRFKEKKKKIYYLVYGFSLIAVFSLRYSNPIVLENFWGIFYTIFIVCFILLEVPYIEKTYLGKILNSLGTYSMGMWFISGIFFTPSRKLQFIAYFPKYPLAILAWVLIITFIFSYILTYLTKKGWRKVIYGK